MMRSRGADWIPALHIGDDRMGDPGFVGRAWAGLPPVGFGDDHAFMPKWWSARSRSWDSAGTEYQGISQPMKRR